MKLPAWPTAVAMMVMIPLGARAAEDAAAFDFITHSEILIAAAPAEVWPHLRNVNAWKAGAKAFRMGERSDVVGERFKAASAPDAPDHYFIETVEITPAQRWTIRLDAKDGVLMGYASWTLSPESAGTRVRYDTYLRSRVPGRPSPEVLAQTARRTNEDAARRMDGEFARLKQLVESAGRGATR